MQTLAILLTVFNRKKKTLECLKNVYSQLPIKGYQVDIYLTDDACSDGTPEVVIQQYPEVHIIHGNGNLYWNRGMYLAWQEAAKINYDFYLWLNDDTFVYSNFLEVLLKTSKNENDNAIIVGATLSTNRQGTTYGGYSKEGNLIIPNGSPTEVFYFNGNLVLIPKYVFKKLGNLDYKFRHSKGDFDYGLRAQKANIRIIQAGIHLGECDRHQELDKWCNPQIPLNERIKALYKPNGMPPSETLYFERKHYNLFIACFHYCTIYLRTLIPLLWKNKKKI